MLKSYHVTNQFRCRPYLMEEQKCKVSFAIGCTFCWWLKSFVLIEHFREKWAFGSKITPYYVSVQKQGAHILEQRLQAPIPTDVTSQPPLYLFSQWPSLVCKGFVVPDKCIHTFRLGSVSFDGKGDQRPRPPCRRTLEGMPLAWS
jgi:hypothetical protein